MGQAHRIAHPPVHRNADEPRPQLPHTISGCSPPQLLADPPPSFPSISPPHTSTHYLPHDLPIPGHAIVSPLPLQGHGIWIRQRSGILTRRRYAILTQRQGILRTNDIRSEDARAWTRGVTVVRCCRPAVAYALRLFLHLFCSLISFSLIIWINKMQGAGETSIKGALYRET
jgi:hypothetical protein